MTRRGQGPTSASEPPPSPNSVKDRLRLRGPSRLSSNDAMVTVLWVMSPQACAGVVCRSTWSSWTCRRLTSSCSILRCRTTARPTASRPMARAPMAPAPTAAAPTAAAPRRAAPSCTAARCWRRARSPGSFRERDLRLFMSAPPLLTKNLGVSLAARVRFSNSAAASQNAQTDTIVVSRRGTRSLLLGPANTTVSRSAPGQSLARIASATRWCGCYYLDRVAGAAWASAVVAGRTAQ